MPSTPSDRPSAQRRRASTVTAALIALAALAPGTATAQWVEFEDQTASRLVAEDEFGALDEAEKDYAYADLDRDGDIDLVVVRKEPFSSAGKRTNRLFLNEGGVLVDRTEMYMQAADLAGDLGFLTETNDRDVRLADFDGDGWLDIVTATTISDGEPTHIGHPRIYINLRNDPDTGDWLGYRYESARIPALLTAQGESGFNPRFCGVGVGDVTDDGRPDLYFSDYDTGQFGPPEAGAADFNDRLLVNDGTGHFEDVTARRLEGTIEPPGFDPQSFETSEFGATAEIADLNGDGLGDIVKITTLVNPLMVAVAYNTGRSGFFDTYQTLDQHAPYFFSLGDLNRDSRLDIVISDDGNDRYLLNQGTNPDGTVDFKSFVFAYSPGASDAGFNNNSRIVDLNNDRWPDVVIAGMDVDFPNCSTRMNIYRNLAGTVGGDVILQEQFSGEDCHLVPFTDRCLIGGIPSNRLQAVFDVAVFDINGDGWKDMVLGKCTGTEVWMNVPPSGLVITYPIGLPAFLTPGEPFVFQAEVNTFGMLEHVAGSGVAWFSIDDGPFEALSTVATGEDIYDVTIPAIETCGADVRFYFTVEADSGEVFADPPEAPANSYNALAALGTQVTWVDDIEGDVSDWTVVTDPSATAGAWERVEPIGAIDGFGNQSAPEGDAEAQADKTMAWVTQNPLPGEGASAHDVDGGPHDLISPELLASGDANVQFSRWFYRNINIDRTLEISVRSSPDDPWVFVKDIVDPSQSWQPESFRVGDFVVPSDRVQVRFRVDDSPLAALVEAGVDVLQVERFICNDCAGALECDDGIFCNGVEQCLVGSCVSGTVSCAGEICDEDQDVCVAPPAMGEVPDGTLATEPLRVDRGVGQAVTVRFGASCVAADADYAVYSGPLGQFDAHTPATCSTGGELTWDLDEPANRFYLVVPVGALREGSYGRDGNGLERAPSPTGCVEQSIAVCPET